MNNTVAVILDAIRPTEPEPLVTYTIPNGAGGDIYVKMPRLFVDLGDDFERWFREESKDLANRFYNEFRVIFIKGGTECNRVVSLFAEAWSYEGYYKFLLGCWQIHEENYEKRNEEANDLEDWGKLGWCQKKLEETRILIFKAKAALYFIYKTKSIITPHIGILGTVQPITQGVSSSATETDQKRKGKLGRGKDSYNAKVKAKFFELAIGKFDSVVLNYPYKNNDEKFEAYAKAMYEHFGLSLAAGTLENNWRKTLNEREKRQVTKLLKEHKLMDLAVKFTVEP